MANEPKNPAEGEPKSPPEAEAPTAAAKSVGPPLLVAIIVSVITLSIGAVAGTMLVGPAFFGKPGPAKVAAEEGEEEQHEAEAGHSGKKKGEEGKNVFMKLENIIVNPSGSQGARFLMVSVAIGLPNEKVGAVLRDREAEVRDAVIGALERHTMDSLTKPGARDQIKADIAAALAPIAGKGKKLSIFLPQFVIQ